MERAKTFRLNFSTPKKEILKDLQLAAKLRFPVPTNRMLGRDVTMWCEFHKTKGHDTNDCLTLTVQLEKLARERVMNKYLQHQKK